jgi:hypothetical protein
LDEQEVLLFIVLLYNRKKRRCPGLLSYWKSGAIQFSKFQLGLNCDSK